jgi:hypothetical protein
MLCRLDKRRFFIVGTGLFTVSGLASHIGVGLACLPLPPLPSRARSCSSLRCTDAVYVFQTQGLTAVLYPLSVVKTRQMVLQGSEAGLRVRCAAACSTRRLPPCTRSCPGLAWTLPHAGDAPIAPLQGAYLTARSVVAHDGLRGLYKGFGVVVGGMFPARMVSPQCRALLLALALSTAAYQ